ncbi:CSEP0039 effector protein [Rutstroemia sp. NJR-2017a BVV2]|nr:CSEP0039 effector protein [Rutstroemia sp. NJR-2017a BVV2]
MLRLYFLLAILATSISALPLNINLGAYSPALVVGDGEISFGGKQDVSNLMNALEGAAVTSAATANNNGQAAAAPAAAAPAAQPQAANTQEQVSPAVTENSEAQITALQGMGKEIAPRIVKLEKSDSEVEKRDIQTLNAALSYASGALKNGPEIQLGTEAAGVGILQKPSTGAAAAAAPANGAAKAARDVASDAKLKTTVTTMFIRGGPAVAKKNVISSSRSVEDLAASAPVEKREPSQSVVDGVNLNMAEGQVAELTFVETRNADEE